MADKAEAELILCFVNCHAPMLAGQPPVARARGTPGHVISSVTFNEHGKLSQGGPVLTHDWRLNNLACYSFWYIASCCRDFNLLISGLMLVRLEIGCQ